MTNEQDRLQATLRRAAHDWGIIESAVTSHEPKLFWEDWNVLKVTLDAGRREERSYLIEVTEA